MTSSNEDGILVRSRNRTLSMAEDGSALGEKCKHAFLLPFGSKRSVEEPTLVQHTFI
jgi:hypothetical protein